MGRNRRANVLRQLFFSEHVFASNLITTIEGLATLTALTYLELNDNRVKAISGLETLVNLTTLDLSYNRIKKIEGLSACTRITKLYIASNRLSVIEGLDTLAGSLQILDLGANRFRVRLVAGNSPQSVWRV
jgi:protein phosphatase 1 regulatory subunit 7